jgi:hypothetical protein
MLPPISVPTPRTLPLAPINAPSPPELPPEESRRLMGFHVYPKILLFDSVAYDEKYM